MSSTNETAVSKFQKPDAIVNSWRRSALAVIFVTIVAAAVVWSLSRATFWQNKFPDVICYWAAGKILAAGQSPYDIGLQTRVQQEYGWNKATDGFGVYDFLPFYYPPWFGFLWTLLLPLGFEGAKTAWFFLNVEMVLITGYLLKRNVPLAPPLVPLALTPVFFFSFACIVLGQTSILVFFFITIAWALLNDRLDFLAGLVLAWLTIKPQLTGVLLIAMLLWAVRQGRWRVVIGFATALILLCLASTLVIHDWLFQMVNAPRATPSPTEHYPWIGNSWFLVLKSLGAHGWGLAALYATAAAPFLVAVIRSAWNRACPLADVLCLSVLAAFFVTPYARHYDFPILLIPLTVSLTRPIPRLAGAALALVLLLLPYAQTIWLADLKAQHAPTSKFILEATYFWVPVLMTVLWFGTKPVSTSSK